MFKVKLAKTEGIFCWNLILKRLNNIVAHDNKFTKGTFFCLSQILPYFGQPSDHNKWEECHPQDKYWSKWYFLHSNIRCEHALRYTWANIRPVRESRSRLVSRYSGYVSSRTSRHKIPRLETLHNMLYFPPESFFSKKKEQNVP